MDSKPTLEADPHPIRLAHIRPVNIRLEVAIVDASLPPTDRARLVPQTTKLHMGHSEIVERDKPHIQVTLGCDLVFEPEQLDEVGPPYALSASVAGLASWDREKIDDKTVLAWAKQGAAYALLPYLRGLVTQISALSGYPPVMIPLLVLPMAQTMPVDEKVPAEEK